MIDGDLIWQDLVDVKLFLKNNMPCGTAYNCNNSSKSIPEKALFTLPNSECTRKANIPTLDQKEDTTVQSQQY